MNYERYLLIAFIAIVVVIVSAIVILSNIENVKTYNLVSVTPAQLKNIYGYNFYYKTYKKEFYNNSELNIIYLNVIFGINKTFDLPIILCLYKFNYTIQAQKYASFVTNLKYISGNYQGFSYKIAVLKKMTIALFYSGIYGGNLTFYQPCNSYNSALMALQDQINDMEYP